MKRTPLYECHQKLGGKMIDFGGWELPVQYSGIIQEHVATRTNAGLFDVSHMGEILVTGPEAEAFLQKIVTNSISGAKENQIVYTPMCYPDGGVVDDLLVYKFSRDTYLLVVNASNTEKDFQWLMDNNQYDSQLQNVSEQYVQIAIQGPKAEQILQKLTNTALHEIRYYYFKPEVEIAGTTALISRTGYTGEDGFEIYISPQHAVHMWETLLEAGKDEGIQPVGLGARDTLRFEASMPLYGQEISQSISPLEAGLSRFVRLDKPDFTGKEALKKQNENGTPRKLIGFEMIDKGIPRPHYEVLLDGKNAGFVTSGSYSPTLAKNLGIALIDSKLAQNSDDLDIIIRNKALKARIIELPFYKKNKK